MATQRDSTIDLRRVLESTSVAHVHYMPEAASTNEVAMRRAGQIGDGESELVLASRQTAGKGRGENKWFSTDGSLTFSLITRVLPIAAGQTPLVSLVAGLAGCQAVEAHAPGAVVRLKWPNDVYVDGRKAAGVLIEVPKQSTARFVIGVGVNVNNSLADSPAEVRQRAISLIDLTRTPIDATQLLIDFLNHLDESLSLLAAGDPRLAQMWSDCSLLTDRPVRLELPNGVLEGVCRGIAADGALLLETDSGVLPCYGGVVESFE